MGATDWLTLRELDERHGAGKGCAFKAFKTVAGEWLEGRDFRVLDATRDADAIAALRAAGRIYRSSVNVVLVAGPAAARLRIASARG